MLENLHTKAKELFGNATDEKTIKAFAEFESELEKEKKVEEELIKRNTSLTKSLKDEIINKSYPSDEINEKPTHRATLEEIAKEYVKKRRK